jgi:hypothetical protein
MTRPARRRALVGLTILLGALAPALEVGAAELEVPAVKVPASKAPAVDGRVDLAWAAATPVRFTVSEGTQGSVEVTLRALRTESDLYLLFQWADKTQSLNRFLAFSGDAWRPARGQEDRLNIAWEVGSTKDFARQGCQGFCHKTEGVMRTNAPGEQIALWYWMSQRTNPVGVADRWVMAHDVAEIEGEKTGRRPVAPTGGPFESNWDDAAKRPRFVPKPGGAPGPALLARDAVAMPGGRQAKAGERVPREILSRPTGARAGIEARGVWASGRWTVEVKRALLTPDARDVQFKGAGPFYFAVSIHDDAARDEHAQMGRDVLKLALP